MNRLYHVVTGNLNNIKYQNNEAIISETTFDTSNFNLSRGTSDPLPVVTVSIQGGKKNRETAFDGLICLWDSGSTNSMIKGWNTNHYERKMRSNKVDYSTAAGVYCTTNDVKVNFAFRNSLAAR